MLWRHYHKAVTQKQAKAFWKIEPRLQIEVENHSLGSLNGLAASMFIVIFSLSNSPDEV
jgi:hypothetical protein